MIQVQPSTDLQDYADPSRLAQAEQQTHGLGQVPAVGLYQLRRALPSHDEEGEGLCELMLQATIPLERAATLMVRLLDVKGGYMYYHLHDNILYPKERARLYVVLYCLGRGEWSHVHRPGKRGGTKRGSHVHMPT